MTGVPSGSAPAATADTSPSWPVRTCWSVARRPWDQRVCQGRAGATPAIRAARLRQPSWWAVSSSWLARPGRSRQSEEVGTSPVHGGGGPRRGGPCAIEVGHQPRRIDGEQVERILKKLIEPTDSGGVLGRVFAQIAVLPTGALGLAEEHVEQGAFVARLVPLGEQLVGEGLVEQPGDRTRAALGRRSLKQVVSSRRTPQDIEISDAGAVAEGGGEGEPGRVVQPGAAGVGERREQPAYPFPSFFRLLVEVLAQRLPDPGRNAGRIEPLRGRVDYCAAVREPVCGHRGDQKVPLGPPRDDGGQPVTHSGLGAVLRPGGPGGRGGPFRPGRAGRRRTGADRHGRNRCRGRGR